MSSRILILTSWSEQSTPAELSIASVLMCPPLAELDSPQRRHTEISALADHLDP